MFTNLFDRENHDARQWQRLFIILFVLTALVRGLFLFLSPFTLSPDEAYYWDWSRHLDWGYYSKPPAVAWIMALASWLFGNTATGIRLPALFLSLGTMLFVYLSAKRMFNAQAGFLAALFMALTPASAVSAFIMTIDAPLLFFWSMSVYFLWRAVEPADKSDGSTDRGVATWWVAAGLAAGAGLLSKQTMAAFWAGTFLFLLTVPHGRRLLRTRWPWISFLISISALTPVIWWNSQHGWITIQHTAHHFEKKDFSMLDSARTFFDFTGSQAVVYSPLTWILLICAGLLSCRVIIKYILPEGSERYFMTENGCRCRKRGTGTAVSCFGSFLKADLPARMMREWMALVFLLSTGFIMLIPIAGLSLRQGINANWPAPFYITMLIFTAGWLSGGFACFRDLKQPRKKYIKAALICGAFFTFALYLAVILLPFTPISGTKYDPLARITGWDHLGMEVEEIYASISSQGKTFIVTKRRQTASALAFYMPSHPVVYRWNGMRRDISTQYEVWDGPGDRKGENALIVLDKDKGLTPDLAGCFEDVRFIKSIFLNGKKGSARYFNVYSGKNMQHWTIR